MPSEIAHLLKEDIGSSSFLPIGHGESLQMANLITPVCSDLDGVPQGSALGPMVIPCFIKEIANSQSIQTFCWCHQYLQIHNIA